MVPSVKALGAELNLAATRFIEDELLEQRKVPVVPARTAQRVEAEVAPGSVSRCGKGCWIGPLNSGYFPGRGIDDLRFRVGDFPNQIRPVADIATWEDAGDVVRVDAEVERSTGLHTNDAR